MDGRMLFWKDAVHPQKLQKPLEVTGDLPVTMLHVTRVTHTPKRLNQVVQDKVLPSG